MVQILIGQWAFSLLRELYKEVDKFRKFRRFLRNIDEHYPLVDYPEAKREDCAICKEVLAQGRRLPCNHAFHWFCIVQLIESGSKNCPICRSEFNNHVPPPVAPGNQNRLNFRGWLPNVQIRI